MEGFPLGIHGNADQLTGDRGEACGAGKIVVIDDFADPGRLRELDLAFSDLYWSIG